MAKQLKRLLDQVRDAIRLKHYSIRNVQELMGHAGVSTTVIYNYVLKKGGKFKPVTGI